MGFLRGRVFRRIRVGVMVGGGVVSWINLIESLNLCFPGNLSVDTLNACYAPCFEKSGESKGR